MSTLRELIDHYRSEGYGTLEAASFARRERVLQKIDEAQTIDDIKVVLRAIVEEGPFKPPPRIGRTR